jgi:hypothetical protein
MTADEVAETLDGVSPETYSRLWAVTSEVERAGKAKPLGGDGSNGTCEEPIIANDYDNSMKVVWKKLTPEQRRELSDAYKKEQARYA